VSHDDRLVLATANRGKVVELETLLRAAAIPGLAVVSQASLGARPAPETAMTFLENALGKARHAARATALPALADDSGLTVDALGDAPGVLSARYAGAGASDGENIDKLLAALAHVPQGSRQARFHCVLVAVRHADDPVPLLATGEWRGEIALAPRGMAGFGYDAVFVDPRLGHTAAELSAEEKNAVSHRGAALRGLIAELPAWWAARRE
jgi:XTP/dITP diphosphohydrolase